MTRYRRHLIFAVILIAVFLIAFFAINASAKKIPVGPFNLANRLPRINPDYNDICLPPNIAPLNFTVLEEGEYYYVKISSGSGQPLEVFSSSPQIIIPEKPWHELLGKNKGSPLYFEISVKPKNGQWLRFNPVSNQVTIEDIDNYVVYRTMYPTHVLYNGPVNICQRDLTGFSEKEILNRDFLGPGSCLNCHSFCSNNPENMLLGIRSPSYGTSTLLVQNNNVDKIDTKFGYTSWHPSGKLAAYSVDNLPMFFHSATTEVRDTVDIDSFIAVYDIDSKTITTPSPIAQKDRLETWPAWSADGKYLYFCSAPLLWAQTDKIPPDRYKDVKYDLVCVSFDINSSQWGQTQTIVSASQTAQSAAMPQVSPDGRWLSFCMLDYGFFPTWQQSSDLYLIDLQSSRQTGKYIPRKLSINSDQSESWHSWSGNSRWIIFSSKRDYGVFTKLYISYLEKDGNFHKPFILPQKDPLFYDSCLFTFNTPEFARRPVQFRGDGLAAVVRSQNKIPVKIPITMATPKVQQTPEFYRQRE